MLDFAVIDAIVRVLTGPLAFVKTTFNLSSILNTVLCAPDAPTPPRHGVLGASGRSPQLRDIGQMLVRLTTLLGLDQEESGAVTLADLPYGQSQLDGIAA